MSKHQIDPPGRPYRGSSGEDESFMSKDEDPLLEAVGEKDSSLDTRI